MKNFTNDAGYLLDSFQMSGDDLDEFRYVVTQLEKSTLRKKGNTAGISLLVPGYSTSLTGDKRQMSLITYNSVRELNETYLLETNDQTVDFSKFDKSLVEETLGNVGFFVVYESQAYFISEQSLTSLFERAMLSGDSMYRKTNTRNAFLVESCYRVGIGERANGKHDLKSTKSRGDMNLTFIIRVCEINGIKHYKIFFVPTEKYCEIRMTALADVADGICDDDELGENTVRYWYLDHGITEIVIAFPTKAEELQEAYKLSDAVTPGVLIRSSDTGKSCFDVKSVAFIGKSNKYVTLETSKRKHYGDVDVEEIVQEANDIVLRNLRKLPEVLAKLVGKPVCDADLTTEVGQRKNEIRMEKLIGGALRKIKMTKVIGKKREIAIRELLLAEVNPETPYTLYDVALMIMTLGERINGVSHVMRDNIAQAVAQVPYVLLDMVGEGQEDEAASEIFLSEEEL